MIRFDNNCQVILIHLDNIGNKIRLIREKKGLLLRQVASAVKIDQALLSKIERGERNATRHQIILLANFLRIDEGELLTLWLGQKIANEIKNEKYAKEALKVAEKNIRYSSKSI